MVGTAVTGRNNCLPVPSTPMSLTNIRIVLLNTTHPGNIGAAARAMKNMCLENLVLVSPREFPAEEASARAAGADDILGRARICATLDEALQGCRLVIGSSARSRTIAWPMLDLPAAAARLVSEAAAGQVALLFGQERTGLTNEQLDRCHFLTAIPANPGFSSLNLAGAVQVLAYEVYLASLGSVAEGAPLTEAGDSPLASADDLQRLYQHLEETLIQIQFLDPRNPRKLMRRLTRLYNRARLDSNELNILRGILTAVQQGWPRNT
jgi:TrmH family RNA methyltransferase